MPHLDPTFHPDQTTLFGVLYTRGLIYGWMVAFEDNATGVPVSPTPTNYSRTELLPPEAGHVCSLLP